MSIRRKQSSRRTTRPPDDAAPVVGDAAPDPNQAKAYGVRVEPASTGAGEAYWKVVSVRHLTPGENQGRHSVYVDALDESGKRCWDTALRIGWSWEGRRSDEKADPKPLDKPDNEPAGNVDLYRGQHVEIWIEGDGLKSDHVLNLHASHPDEPGPSGELWNASGHHSFHAIFQRAAAGRQSKVEPVITTKPVPPAFRFSAWPTERRIVTQWFAANAQYYARFNLPGHEGIDIAAPGGTRIFSVAAGRVKMVHPEPTGHNYGIHVRVLHEQGYETIYAHLQSLQVEQGQEVAAGQVLGLADSTGNSDGDHLHLTLKHAGETQGAYPNNIIDPTPFLVPLLAPTRDGAEYISDKIPDGSHFPSGTPFVQTWRFKNTGGTGWSHGYELALFGGDALGAPAAVPLPPTPPGQTADVSVTFQTPAGAGRCRSLWKCRNAAGAWFGERVWVDIQVMAGEQQPLTRQVTTKEKLGIDANAPINRATGAIAPQVADSAIIGDIGSGWVRLNFILGPWASPLDTAQHDGRTWEQTYRSIVDALRGRGLRIYGLINHEALRDNPGSQFRDPPPAGPVANDWIRRYAETFQQIARLFHGRVDVFETFNEPDNWTRLPGEAEGDPGWRRAWIHPEWFAILLQGVWKQVRGDPQTAGTKIVSGPLQGLDTGNSARDYLRRTYQAGKRRFGWGQASVPFPFDGVGYHLYIAQNPPNPAQDVPAKYNQFTAEVRQVIADEEGAPKPLFISEMGWRSAIGEDKQAECMRAGLGCILNDPGTALGVWFCTQDWSENWGLYRQGDLSPAGRKPAYGALQNICRDARTVPAAAWLPLPPAAPRAATPDEMLRAPLARPASSVPLSAVDPDLWARWRQHVEHGLARNQELFDELLDALTASLKPSAEPPGSAAGLPAPDESERLRRMAWLSIVLNTYWSRLAHLADPSTLQLDFDEISRTALAQLRELEAHSPA